MLKLLHWIEDRILSARRLPRYKVGQILDLGLFNGLGTITSYKWDPLHRRWIYFVDEYGDLSQSRVTEILKQNGDLGAV